MIYLVSVKVNDDDFPVQLNKQNKYSQVMNVNKNIFYNGMLNTYF